MRSDEGAGLDVDGLEASLDALEVRPEDARDATALGELFAAVDERRRAESRVQIHVARARRAGLSWGDIARALGVTRQGARQRYGASVELAPGESRGRRTIRGTSGASYELVVSSTGRYVRRRSTGPMVAVEQRPGGESSERQKA